jgi:hypothetical protein
MSKMMIGGGNESREALEEKVLKAIQSLHSLTIDIQKFLCHDHWPFVNGFAGAIENPT